MVELTFQNPLYLWYLISIPMLVASHFYFLRYTKYKGLKFANFDALKRVKGHNLLSKNYSVLGLRLLILTSLILAASGPTLWYEGQTTRFNYVIALDTSASMTSQDVEPSRIEVAKDTIRNFLDRLESMTDSTEVGLLAFSGTTYIEQSLTQDLDEVRRSLDQIQIRKEGGTDIAGALVTATNMMLNSDKDKKVLFISDGSTTATSSQERSMRNAMSHASNEQVTVHALGIGTDTGPVGYLPEYYNATSIFKGETLKNIANVTDGTYQKINTEEEREQALDVLSEESEQGMIDVELSYGLLLIALFLIFLEWGLISTRFRRLP